MNNFRPIGYFKESPLVPGDYLLGNYSWTYPVVLASVDTKVFPPQTTPVVLGLEVNGNLTGQTVTLGVGTPNLEAAAAAGLGNVSVAPGQVVRWKVISAPDAELSAWKLSLTMQIQY